MVSLATSPKADPELRGLVYGLTEQPSEKEYRLVHAARRYGAGGAGNLFHAKPATLGTFHNVDSLFPLSSFTRADRAGVRGAGRGTGVGIVQDSHLPYACSPG